tara:strand:+ start:640 stop:1077 length:438 start_codon:yes stop_codon:yes gene_type:complete
MDILEEYRGESDQTICVAGTIILAVKICEVDGHFSLYEKDEILKTFPTDDQSTKKAILDIIDKASKDKHDVKYHAERIKKFVDSNHTDFLDFIIATLIKFAKADHHFHDKEKDLILEVIKIFERDREKNTLIFKIKKNLGFKKKN